MAAPGAVGQARIHHGRRSVRCGGRIRGDDPVDDAQKMSLVLEMNLGVLEFTKALDVDPLVRVDQNVGDGRILQERLDRTVAGHFSEDLIRENVELSLIEGEVLVTRVIADIRSYLLGELFGRKLFKSGEVEFVDDAFVQL